MDSVLGEIRLFTFDFAPMEFVPCDGRLLEIQMYQALYSLIGPAYGGDGKTTFAVPTLAPLAPQGPHYCICLHGMYPTRPRE